MSCLSCRADKARRARLCDWWPQRRRGERTVLANGDAINRSLTADKTAILNGRWVRISCHYFHCALPTAKIAGNLEQQFLACSKDRLSVL